MLITPGTKPSKFTLNRKYREELTTRQVKWNIPGLSEFTYYRTYSRKKDNGKLETWNECVIRVIEGMFSILKTHSKINMIPWDEKRANKLAQEAADRMFVFKWLPPGRGLWMMGTEFVFEKGGAALNNCGFVSTQNVGASEEETVMPFTFLMDMSMLGVGVGFDTEGAGQVLVKGYSDEEEVFEVDDCRESWVELIGETIKNGIYGGPKVVPDVARVRPENQPIRGFGGVSSGPEPLIKCAQAIAGILTTRAQAMSVTNTVDGTTSFIPSSLTATDIVDIQNLIGKCVVAGNVRRTAEIAFADANDQTFLNMKNFSEFGVETGSVGPDELKAENEDDYNAYNANLWDTQNGIAKAIVQKYNSRDWAWKFGGWRWASNNSVFAKVGQDYTKYERSIGEAGEPGFAWLDNMRAYGRMCDPPDNRDYRVSGGNPCLEQSLETYELCCLVESFPAFHDDYWDYQRTLKFAYMYAKTVTLMGTHFARTNAVIIRNRRIGTSMSGIAEAIAKVGRSEFMRRWCNDGYNYVDYLDKKYSDWLGVPNSIKKTSVKPSGTTSLVAGAFCPGIHFAKMKCGYRLIRVAVNSALLPILKAGNYRVEPSVTDPLRTAVVYFPWITPEGTTVEEDTTIWEKFKMAADLQHYWADNQVSCTVEFTPEEHKRGEIARCLSAFDAQLKGISLLPSSSGGAYKQMPFSPADRAEVEGYVAQLLPLDFSELTTEGENADANKGCDGSGCIA